MKKFVAIFVFIMLTACSGEQSGQCIPGDAKDDKTASGKSQNTPEAIFEYVKDKQIISTTIDKIKKMVIGTSPIFNLGPLTFSPNAGAAQNMFTSITSNPSFTSAISAAFSLAIIFYGIGVATGIIQVTLGDALIRVGKILAVAYIATNWTLFYEMVGSFFITTTDEIIGYMLQNFGGLYAQGPSFAGGININLGGSFNLNAGSLFGAGGTGLFSVNSANNLFADIDLFFAQIFSVHTWAIIMALISPFGKNAGPYSNIYMLFLVFSLFQMITGILKVVLIYTFSLFAKALLFALAPIFFTFMLFNATKHLFDAWLKLQISFTLQPIFVMSLVGIFVSVLSPLYRELYALKVCYLPIDGDKHGWVFVNDAEDARAYASSVSDTPPIKLQTLLMMTFFSWLFKGYLTLAESLANSIAQSVGGNLANTANSVAQNLGMNGGGAGGGALQSLGVGKTITPPKLGR